MERNFGIKVKNDEQKDQVLSKLLQNNEKVFMGFSVGYPWEYICFDKKLNEWSLCRPGLERYEQDYYITAEEFLLEELKPGFWYRSSSKENSLYFLEDINLSNKNNPHKSYGINGVGKWSDSMNSNLKGFFIAEQKIIKEAMIKQAKMKYENKKIKCLANEGITNFNPEIIDFYFSGNDMYSGGAQIYKNGKWATIEGEIKNNPITEPIYEIY